MVYLQISEELDASLEDAANRAGSTKQELAQTILRTHLEEETLSPSAFTSAQLDRLKESAAQLDRGEYITAEQVDEKFEAFFARSTAR